MTQTFPDGVEIRKAVPDDLPALRDLWVEFMDFHLALDPGYRRRDNAVDRWAAYIQSKFNDETATVFVAVGDGGILGYIGAALRDFPPVYVVERYGLIEEIAVTHRERRRGVASALYEAAENWLREHGVDCIRVTINFNNDASQGFFRSRGFRDDTETLTKKI